jgi:hypothetical protein
VCNLDQWGFCVVGSGAVEIRLIDNASGDDQLQTSSIFHRAREGDSLLPMYTILGVLLEAMHEKDSPNMSSRLPALPSSSHFPGCFEVVASEDVHLYAAERPRMRQWVLDQRESSNHVFEEILRRFFCMTAPICITYLGLEKHWSTLMIKLSATPRITRQNPILEMASTTRWLREALGNVQAREAPGKDSSVVLSGMESTLFSSVHSRTAKAQRSTSMLASQKKRLSPMSKNISVPRTSRGPIPLRLQTSIFEESQGGHSTGQSPLYKAENHSISQQTSLEEASSTKKDNNFGLYLRQEIARQIIVSLSSESNSQLGNSTVWSDDRIESLATQYAGCIEVVYFAKNAVLVHQGCRYPGVIFVIDGVASLRSPQNAGHDTKVNDGQFSSLRRSSNIT